MQVAPPDYEAIERDQWKQAHKEVANEANRPTVRLRKRIAAFAGSFSYPPKDVLMKIETDAMFSAHFAKEPRRTGLHEASAAKWIQALPDVENFHTLPKSGKNSMKVTSDGNIVKSKKQQNIPGKSLDSSMDNREQNNLRDA